MLYKRLVAGTCLFQLTIMDDGLEAGVRHLYMYYLPLVLRCILRQEPISAQDEHSSEAVVGRALYRLGRPVYKIEGWVYRRCCWILQYLARYLYGKCMYSTVQHVRYLL